MKGLNIFASLNIAIVLSVFTSCLTGQEIVGIQESIPRTRILIRRPDSSVVITNIDDFSNIGLFAKPKNFQVLDNPKILENVELSKAQKNRLAEISALSKKKALELSKSLQQSLSTETSETAKLKIANEHIKKWKSFVDEMSKELGEDLIPFQSKMIARHDFQQSILRFGLGRSLLSSPWKDDLKIDKKQTAEIKRLNDEMNATIKKQIAKIKAETDKKIKRLLDKDQNKTISDLEKNIDEKWSYPH